MNGRGVGAVPLRGSSLHAERLSMTENELANLGDASGHVRYHRVQLLAVFLEQC
jgi:hypothetical protein